MGKHVIVGAGPVGATTARELADQGHEVTVVTRSGNAPDDDRVVRVSGDATDGARLAEIARGADAIYNCANPAYHRWHQEWPPLAAALLQAAEHTGAGLVTMSNLYGYAPGTLPMREDSPLAPANAKCAVRADMWAAALAAHESGRVRATEARASDFFGPGVTQAIVGAFTMEPLLRGRTVRVLGRADVDHSVTYIADVGRTLAALGTDPRSWGSAWHVPTNPAVTQRELFARLAAALGQAGAPAVRPLPKFALAAAGVLSRDLREMRHVAYQTQAPFVVDSTHTEATFGLAPTPWEEAIAATARWWSRHAGGAEPEPIAGQAGRRIRSAT